MKPFFIKSIIVVFMLLLYCFSYGQISKRLDVNLAPQEINNNSFDGKLRLKVKNVSKDTIYITLEPFNFDIVNRKGIDNYVNLKRTKYSPNRITFVRSDIKMSDIEGWSPISFLRFPSILCLIPGETYEFLLNVDKNTLFQLRDSSWAVYEDLWCAVKSNVDNIIKNKSLDIIQEFKEALIYEDKININLISNKQANSCIYFYNNLDSCNEQKRCYTVYDSIILKCFNNYYY